MQKFSHFMFSHFGEIEPDLASRTADIMASNKILQPFYRRCYLAYSGNNFTANNLTRISYPLSTLSKYCPVKSRFTLVIFSNFIRIEIRIFIFNYAELAQKYGAELKAS